MSMITRSSSNCGLIPIRELSEYEEQKVNVIGVVLEFSFFRKSSGTDYVTILKIVDDSQQSPEVSVAIFTERINQLPLVKSHGDLILLRNVLIKQHKEGNYSATFNKKYSSFALFDGNVSNDFTCYQAFGTFSVSRSEQNSITNIRSWFYNAKIASGKSEYLLSIQDLTLGTHFDLVCKVLHVLHDVSKDLWMLFVWDGTDIPPLSLNENLEDEEQNPFPLQIESFPLDEYTLNKFPHLGTVLRVMADPDHKNLGLHFQTIPKWVRIRNMTCHVSAGMWHGSLNTSSKIRLLANNDAIVEDRKREFQERQSKYKRLPLLNPPISLTVIYCKNADFSTLMDVITYGKDECFACIVRVVAIHPLLAEDMRMTLEDPTARIHAHLSGEEWVRFFNGHPSADMLLAKIKMLLGAPEHGTMKDTRFPPWIKCCIHRRTDDTGSIAYHICSTSLVTTS